MTDMSYLGVNSQKYRALLGWAGETSFDYAQDRLCPYVAVYPPSTWELFAATITLLASKM